MIIQFKIGENATKDILCVWHLALSKLRCNLSTVDDENEWFDEYSIYTKSTQALIKSENDFTHYFQQCINTGNASDAVTTPTSVPIIVKVSFFCLSLHNCFLLFSFVLFVIFFCFVLLFCFFCLSRILAGLMNTNILIIG